MEYISDAAKRMLVEKLLPFWKSLRDKENGGYYGYMDFDLNLNKKGEKGCILNSRILWFFSQAALILKDDSLIPYARQAYEFLRDRCMDREYGGVYWSLTWDGQPLDDSKHTYCQAFAIYGLSAYYQLTGDQEALNLARELFVLIEKKCTDEGGYLEAFSRDFTPVNNEKLSENGVIAERTMNTLLHVFEGYAELYQAAHDPQVAQMMLHILDIYAAKIYNPRLHRQEVFCNKDYIPLIDLTSYGHDIESSWLIDWGTALLEDETAKRAVFTIDSDLADHILRTAFRPDGSVVNECEKGVVDEHRVWWVQAEAVLGFVNAWEKHPQRVEFREAVAWAWRYINKKVIDPRPGGEWFWRLNADGTPDREKPTVEPWKCPYHNGRMCLELIRRNPNVYI